MKKALKRYLIPSLWITLASAVYAVGFNWCYVPNQIGFGGITGVGQIDVYKREQLVFPRHLQAGAVQGVFHVPVVVHQLHPPLLLALGDQVQHGPYPVSYTHLLSGHRADFYRCGGLPGLFGLGPFLPRLRRSKTNQGPRHRAAPD